MFAGRSIGRNGLETNTGSGRRRPQRGWRRVVGAKQVEMEVVKLIVGLSPDNSLRKEMDDHFML